MPLSFSNRGQMLIRLLFHMLPLDRRYLQDIAAHSKPKHHFLIREKWWDQVKMKTDATTVSFFQILLFHLAHLSYLLTDYFISSNDNNTCLVHVLDMCRGRLYLDDSQYTCPHVRLMTPQSLFQSQAYSLFCTNQLTTCTTWFLFQLVCQLIVSYEFRHH